MQQDFEKLGVFYLGRPYDLAQRKPQAGWLLYDSKDLVTHAVCVGMTGSGKTGLCLSLLEEAAIDGIPAIVIDPKGDLGNLLLAFPKLAPEDFRPWVNADEARTQGIDSAELATREAARWKEGLASWSQDGERIARMLDAADFAIYTPGSSAGLPVSILKSFAAPPAALVEDEELLRERVASSTSSLLGLLGIDADPLSSREHILLATIFDRAWRAGEDLDLALLIERIQKPPVQRVGVFELEAFFPAKERFALAMRINNLLASPSFAAWMEGEPLDVGAALWTKSGKPRISIYSIAHLSESERMFFVSLLLSQIVAWMRTQPGTTSLRALVYMDEIFGFFPPVANPPSKQPLLSLLKQARAYGLGVVLATQNPVDLDYKGLSNCGTWFLGRLQTERDKQRVLEGLEGAAAQAGSGFDRARMEETLAGLGKRVFLMNNVHDSQPVVFETRWTLSYLAGPMARNQIKLLMDPRRGAPNATAPAPTATAAAAAPERNRVASPAAAAGRPALPPEVTQRFLPTRVAPAPNAKLVYLPALFASTSVWFQDAKLELSSEQKADVILELEPAAVALDWNQASRAGVIAEDLELEPRPDAEFGELPAAASKPKSYDAWSKALVETLFRGLELSLWKSPSLELVSRADEDERAFRIRLQQAAREERDRAAEKLRSKYAPKRAVLDERLRRAEQQLEKERAEASEAKVSSFLSIGASLLGAFTGRKTLSAAKVSRVATGARAVGRSAKQGADVGRAEENIAALGRQLDELEQAFRDELTGLEHVYDPLRESLERLRVRPKKTNIAVRTLVLAWMPHWRTSDGRLAPAWG
ncbi:MAG: DUF87 domain-containing protein [Planctomycetes bacterium]|nr:DUF87 domain-containing protein [Planctomycetota bacterium]